MSVNAEAGGEIMARDSSDCLGCRLVGGGGLMGASFYVAYQGSRNTNTRGRLFTYLFAGALGGVGITRLFRLPPFDKKHQKITEVSNQ
ncbi:hypothetical protein Pcinc_012919 [Petrolisthes cinctipes]|uniref:Distal membrane-arm assembly complex protein 1-like domain-containing protein n=1 Tax=Petrolisthes cinctipes TaxID=88211 RepID=A0AAE1KST4_PETCI|nr:hypothetical protein Pcinc_012919 [Petrolisthes cinctipes]